MSKPNSRSLVSMNGGATGVREENDFYATDPYITEQFLNVFKFDNNVWECACGQGHMSEVLKKHGYNVRSTDLIDRGYGEVGIDFLETTDKWHGDIVTNPPFSHAKEFVEHGLEIIEKGHYMAFLLKIQFLETKGRRPMFEKYPPRYIYIYISTNRVLTAKNGNFEKYSKGSAFCLSWFIWEKGYTGEPHIRWYNPNEVEQ